MTKRIWTYLVAVSVLVISFVVIGYAYNTKQVVEIHDSELGISLEVPKTWSVERGGRAPLLKKPTDPLIITPKPANPMALMTILPVRYAQLDQEIKRVERMFDTYDVVQNKEIELFEIDGYPATRIELVLSPKTKLLHSGNEETPQRMDLVIYRRASIVLHVQKSEQNEVVNEQLENIVHSIFLDKSGN